MQKDGYRRKPLPPKDDGAIELNFVPVKICSIKGCYQPIPADYERKTCMDCQERYKGYAVTKRAKRRALKRAQVEAGGSSAAGAGSAQGRAGRGVSGDDDMSGIEDDLDGDGSGPEDDALDADLDVPMDGHIPIDPSIHSLAPVSADGVRTLPSGFRLLMVLLRVYLLQQQRSVHLRHYPHLLMDQPK
jgi:hypothetical protein